jgi:hypothetical protein
MLRDHHPPLRDVTTDTENTASCIVAFRTVFRELLPSNALIKSVILYIFLTQTPPHQWYLHLIVVVGFESP